MKAEEHGDEVEAKTRKALDDMDIVGFAKITKIEGLEMADLQPEMYKEELK